MLLALTALSLGLFFCLLRGAPYVPTRQRQIEQALDLLGLSPDDLVADLGCGDGRLLISAAKRGLRAVGFEINPLLWMVSWLRCHKYRCKIKVLCLDFMSAKLPDDLKAVYVFSAGPFVGRLVSRLERHVELMGRPLLVASYAFRMHGLVEKTNAGGIFVYEITPKVPASSRALAQHGPS